MNDHAPETTEILAFPRRASVEDLPDVAKIYRLAFFTAMPQMPVLHSPAEDLNYFLTGVYVSSELWVLEAPGGVSVGFIAFRPGWVDHLYVVPKYQRHGLGSSLLSVAMASSATLRARTFRCNWGGRHFFEKYGFRMEGETDGRGNEEKQPDVLYVWERNAGAKQ
ncbi:GCN5-related N-acetyltransferase [Chthoniobacter flavus Ellin428]|uniref:GCN5-related N-acetyltransferase n=1 Tax=Chthoniobacter flavus Ellin428 TaxID=497964 RepID=B4CU72_9BACT|nr:GNAT family N-acetyltransferase [Chthoniobacter flavus]EDY22110.1 GCN5-related N-acetyltransferase [Chthoniobacter flavus Ellin428]TCO94856.1 L-amino acid N-acyltransferase YncA [Chthoniobacter flavus]